MNKYFRLQLTIILIIFSIVISFVIAIFDYGKLKDQVHISHETKIEMAENAVINSLHTIDKAYHFFDTNTANRMEKYTEVLLEKYEDNPDFETWNFEELKERFEMDIFIIDANNVVTYSSFIEDIGLDFNECCTSFANLLDKRRMNGAFYHDGMDIQQSDGQIKKFSYRATPDHKYIIELGVSLEDDDIFKEFNFLDIIDALESEHKAIHSIHVYSSVGLILGYMDADGRSKEVDENMRSIFKEALSSGEAEETVKKVDGQNLTYRYIRYVANETRGLSTNRIVEIIYDDAELEGLLAYYREELMFQLLVIVIGAIGLSFIIARLVAKPIYLAFHDSLTGLKNRAAFEDELEKKLRKNKGSVALMMIDIDNFKLVNDSLGHAEGDRILKYTAKTIQEEVGSTNIASRVGGDEFVVVFSEVERNEVKQIAESMVDKIKKEFSILHDGSIDVSISVGIAFAIDGDKVDRLYDRADNALYTSKENGKNQYTIYNKN